MRILVFSDIHGDLRGLQSLMDIEADYYFAAGDMVNWAQGLDLIGPVLQQRAERLWIIPGNHESDYDIQRLCSSYQLNHFHGKAFQVGGWHFAGLGYSNPTPFNTPGEYTEEQIAERLAPFEGLSPLVLICHCPPHGTELDEALPRFHYGSKAVRSFIDRCQPSHFFCGHIHEAGGRVAQLGGTRAVNVGKKGHMLELDIL